ncbi:MAG: SNF2-related protein, partial [Sphaerospermopsis sp.]|nr:SNF2-related protein [Sphaerospermopsis sp.]
MNREDLHGYQNAVVNFITKKLRCALFLDMGLGKTVITLTAISDLLDDFRINKVLIIAPLRVANSVWQQEAQRWSHLEHLNISICTGTFSERQKALESGDIHIVNKENVTWLVRTFKNWKYDMVVVDESSGFKSHTSMRFKALRSVLKYTESLVLLTGTPTPNGYMDL